MTADNRTDKNNDKYKMFRNFMVNELGITRQDIEAWTKQAVANEISKIIGQINVSEDRMIELASKEIQRTVKDALGHNNRFGQTSNLQAAVVAELSKNLKLSVVD